MKIPKVGDKIYIPSAYYVYRGEDDFVGGLAVISKVEISNRLPIEHFNSIMVGIENRPSTMYNYKNLLEEQEELKKRFGNEMAYPDPDLREEFNQPDADWKIV